ncbi:hypothetical protein XENOCAPTIV_029840 [Xenoophorus captivus]|uniref:Secreted protein n=1 Tax=Xenoophorus captivus TaxID=1517983 RepID=A0ABV0RP87_9TELE
MKSRHTGVNGLLCAWLVPLRCIIASTATRALSRQVYRREPSSVGIEPAGTSHAGQAIPPEPVQELEFLILLYFLSCVSKPSMKLPLPSWASDCSSFSDRSNTWPVV